MLAVEFEAGSPVSLPMFANMLRLAGEPVKMKLLPGLAGASPEAVSMARSFLTGRGFAEVSAPPGERELVMTLTPAGQRVRTTCIDRLSDVEESWNGRYGDVVDRVRAAVEGLVGRQTIDPRVWQGLEPPEGTWRASTRRPTELPHFPLILHRGGYPDGA
jgi:hypothetical protein